LQSFWTSAVTDNFTKIKNLITLQGFWTSAVTGNFTKKESSSPNYLLANIYFFSDMNLLNTLTVTHVHPVELLLKNDNPITVMSNYTPETTRKVHPCT